MFDEKLLDEKYKYLRPIRREVHKARYMEPLQKRHTLSESLCDMATLLPLKNFPGESQVFGRGGVIHEEKYIRESGIDGMYFSAYDVQECDYVDEDIIYGGAFIKQWGHFLMEGTTRLWSALQNVDKRIGFIVEENREESIDNTSYEDFFELLGIRERIFFVSKPTTFRSVIVPEPSLLKREYYSDEFLSMFKLISERVKNELGPYYGPKNVFLTRSNKNSRVTDIGLEVIENFWKENDFSIINMETLPFREQVHMMQGAEQIALIAGSLQHNLLFSANDTKVYVLERQPAINDYQICVDKLKEMHSLYIDAFYYVFPSSIGDGLFFEAYNSELSRFAKEMNFASPSQEYLTDSYRRKCLVRYLRIYKKRWYMNTNVEKWQMIYAETLWEARRETEKELGRFLSGEKAIYWWQYISLKYVRKIFPYIVNRIIK